jgi:hypothetical protein
VERSKQLKTQAKALSPDASFCRRGRRRDNALPRNDIASVAKVIICMGYLDSLNNLVEQSERSWFGGDINDGLANRRDETRAGAESDRESWSIPQGLQRGENPVGFENPAVWSWWGRPCRWPGHACSC